MDTLILTPLTNLETHLSALITTLSQSNTFTTAPQLAQSLLTDDDNLTTALTLLQRHQQNYARILHLREEVSTLQEQLKDTIRKCVSFRSESGSINARILEEDSEAEDEDEEDGKGSVAEVDYHTLLTFAARIGKHNTLAAKEAEAEAVRRRIAARKASSSVGTANDTQTTELLTQGTTITTTAGQDSQSAGQNNTAETTAELERISALIAVERARMGMSFPDGSILRLGALGSLQLLRERAQQAQSISSGSAPGEDGMRAVEDAVEKEVGRLVRESEGGIVDDEIAPEEDDLDVPVPESPVLGRREGPSGQIQGHSQGQTQRPAKPKGKLDLDFPDSDDDDDD